MGAFLSKPVTEKSKASAETDDWACGVAAMQGYRVEMEDAHCLESEVDKIPNLSFFGVFDGHGGKLVSTSSEKGLLNAIINTPSFAQAKSADLDANLLGRAMVEGFLKWDSELAAVEALKTGTDQSGSTAVTCFVTKTHIIVANCGDSRCVISTVRETTKFASQDHKPENEIERARILAAGGHVHMGRVNGDLAVARALGDFVYKRVSDKSQQDQQVSPLPEITIIPRDTADPVEYIILACDGIWDVMANAEAIKFIREIVAQGCEDFAEVAAFVCDECLNRESRDNMSVCIVGFKGAYTKPSPEAIAKFKAQQEARAREAAAHPAPEHGAGSEDDETSD